MLADDKVIADKINDRRIRPRACGHYQSQLAKLSNETSIEYTRFAFAGTPHSATPKSTRTEPSPMYSGTGGPRFFLMAADKFSDSSHVFNGVLGRCVESQFIIVGMRNLQ